MTASATGERLSAAERGALLDVVARWFDAPERVFSLSRPWAHEPPVDALPPSALDLMTHEPAEREQVTADGLLYHTLGRHQPLFGPEYQLRTLLPYEWDDRGCKVVEDLEVRLAWSWDMAGAQPDWTALRLARVRLERGQWRVAAFYRESDRQDAANTLAWLRARSAHEGSK